MPKESLFPVIWDSGASISVSPHRSDFVGPYTKPPLLLKLRGLAKGLKIVGQGHVMWAVQDANGMLRAIKVPAYHVPECDVRLLSTTSLLQTYPAESIALDKTKLTLSGQKGEPTRGQVIALIDKSNNLPTSLAYKHSDVDIPVKALTATITAVNADNHNITEPEKELLRWHYRLGHLGFRRIQALMRSGVLAHSQATRSLHVAASKIEHPPKCAACQYGKQTRRPSPGKKSSAVKDKSGALKKDDLFAGQKIAVDHFVCSTKGRLFTSKGKTAENEMFCGGCVYVDHATGYLFVAFQKQLNTHETLKAKEQFELMCRDHGVIPQSYLSDNASTFTSQGYTGKLREFAQIMTFAGAGAHHHNGTAERAIGTVTNMARTMMLHSAIHWPDIADSTLWPMAVAHAVYLYNHMPSVDTGISPADLFTKTRWEQRKFHDVHVWGCPVYVLDKSLSDGKKIPRWKPRSKRSMYMGNSPQHASTVPLVLNPETGSITAQFHVVFDDWFATVAASASELPDFNSEDWARMFGDATYLNMSDENETDEPTTNDEKHALEADRRRDQVARAFDSLDPPTPLPAVPLPETIPTIESPPAAPASPDIAAPVSPPSAPVSETRERGPPPLVPRRSTPAMSSRREPTQVQQPSSRRERAQESHQEPAQPVNIRPTSQGSGVRRSQRTIKPPNRHSYDGSQGRHGYFAGLKYDSEDASGASFMQEPMLHALYHYCGLTNPVAFKASSSDPDTLTFDQAMADFDNKLAWKKAMENEIRELENHGTWEQVPVSDAQTKILPLTWVLRRKRTPDGEIKKLKARICVRGDLQEGEFDTYAPVVSWISVRIFLVLTMTMKWVTCSIDFSNAFVQSELKEPVWVHLPRGFSTDGGRGVCLRLKRSLYGIAIAPRLWFETAMTAMLELGLKQSQHDPCLLYKGNLMIVLYVDDAGIAAPTQKEIDDFVQSLKEKGFQLTQEGSFSEFLGIKFEENNNNGTITLTQKGLIQKIIAATNMEDCNPNWTPASSAALGIDPEGPPMDESWSYPSIVGMLLYLSTNTRPDITFAVSQVARFNHSPKQSHASAVKMIVRYLARTWDKGMIVKPTGDLAIDCYVDADFASLYGRDPDTSVTSAKSRLGYIISLGGVPLVWKSQLQQEIALSTQESEYSALSQAIRVVIPIRNTLQEIIIPVGLDKFFLHVTVRARVFEDNNGAFLLATGQRITNRTKYYTVKWHHFWHHVRVGNIEIIKIGTLMQRADILTKGLTRELFESIRKMNQGW